MSNELFHESEVSLKSPRLRWMERHGIYTWKATFIEDGDDPWTACKGTPGEHSQLMRDIAIEGFRMLMDGRATVGNSEDEALARLCRNLGLKLWNEEEGI